jgi:dipeptidyl-peptidase-4
VDLIRLPGHETVRVLEDNGGLREKLAALNRGESGFFRTAIEDVLDSAGEDVDLDGWCIKPPDFDPARKYPLLFYVYGEPAGQTVLDRWGGDYYLWHLLLAQQGYVIMSIDNRGTPAPRGRAWRKCVYGKVGLLASLEQAAAARAIMKSWPWIDESRIGTWGWSGGGSMSLNAIFRHPDLYHTALAVATVSDQRLYDTIYMERYMGLPQESPENYRQGSPITFAHRLEGNLLLVHGTGDDNCHYQGAERLINELVKHNKRFTMMAYPNRSHNINEGKNTRRHLFELLTWYLNDNLAPGPR